MRSEHWGLLFSCISLPFATRWWQAVLSLAAIVVCVGLSRLRDRTVQCQEQ